MEEKCTVALREEEVFFLNSSTTFADAVDAFTSIRRVTHHE